MDSELHDRLKKLMESSESCYIFISCGEPTDDGNMRVEMSYDGDPVLVSYLLENAQNTIDEQVNKI